MAQIGTRKLKIEIDGDDYTADVSNARFTTSTGGTDFLSFAAAATGDDLQWNLEGTAAQDAASASFWSAVFDNAGDDVPVTLMPYGNATPTTSEPHFTATVTLKIPEGDVLGGEANTSTSARFTFDFSFPSTSGKPARVTA